MNNGFYIWNPIPEIEQGSMHHLYLEQVVQVIDGNLWVTGMDDTTLVSDALEFGSFGDCVLPTANWETILVTTGGDNDTSK